MYEKIYGKNYQSTWAEELIICYEQAANYLDIKNLLDLTCQALAEEMNFDEMNSESPEQIRKMLKINKDFLLEIKKETQWAFE